MPLDEILFIDTERKTLPFRQAARCKVKTISSWKQFEAVMKAGSGLLDFKANEQDKADYYNPVKIVVVDSFTRILYLLSEFLKRNKVTGYDYWREYSDILEQLLMTWQSKGRFIVFTALDEIVRDSDSIDRIVVKVDGKKLEGKIESFFTIVLHNTSTRSSRVQRLINSAQIPMAEIPPNRLMACLQRGIFRMTCLRCLALFTITMIWQITPTLCPHQFWSVARAGAENQQVLNIYSRSRNVRRTRQSRNPRPKCSHARH